MALFAPRPASLLPLVLLLFLSGALGMPGDSGGNHSVMTYNVDGYTALRSGLLTNYSAQVRPEGTVTVLLMFNLLSLNDLDIRGQFMTVSGYFTVKWNDSRLVWDSSIFSSIRFLFAREGEVWRPALIIENSVENLDVLSNDDVPFRVLNSGIVEWSPPGIFKVHCDVDITFYPFDTQVCYLSVQSWGYNLRELDLETYGSGVFTDDFRQNGEWELRGAATEREESTHDSNSFANLRFKLTFRRKPLYYGLNLLLPILVNSVLTALVFALPPDSGEKMGYSLTVLLSMAVLLTLVADRMPTTAQATSIMGVYTSIVLCLGAGAVMLTTVVLDIYFRDERDPVPRHVKKLASVMRKCVCLRGCSCQGRSKGDNSISPFPSSEKPALGGSAQQPVVRGDEGDDEEGDEAEDITWKELAVLIDVVFFRFFIISIVLVSVVVFVKLILNV